MKYIIVIFTVVLPVVMPSDGAADSMVHYHQKFQRSTPEEAEAISEFCSQFQPTQEEILHSQGNLEEMSSGCDGICSYYLQQGMPAKHL
uniref:Uncharacterized protein n=1 Tax=Rhodnius prolixus TaxID=13249 RepID=T1I380_RHOPR